MSCVFVLMAISEIHKRGQKRPVGVIIKRSFYSFKHTSNIVHPKRARGEKIMNSLGSGLKHNMYEEKEDKLTFFRYSNANVNVSWMKVFAVYMKMDFWKGPTHNASLLGAVECEGHVCGWRGENVFEKSDFAFSNNAYLFRENFGQVFRDEKKERRA